MRQPTPGELAWAGIVAYEILCPKGELLSEVLDRLMPVRHPRKCIAVRAFIVYTAAHCANILDPKFDIYQWLAAKARR